jgi:hypothetical protein
VRTALDQRWDERVALRAAGASKTTKTVKGR